jgi:hypothetical protein
MGVPSRSIWRGGMIGAIAAIYVALVGLYTRFADLELVGEQITLGRLLLVAPALVAAYAVTRPRVVAGERRPVAFGPNGSGPIGSGRSSSRSPIPSSRSSRSTRACRPGFRS